MKKVLSGIGISVVMWQALFGVPAWLDRLVTVACLLALAVGIGMAWRILHE